MMFKLLTLLASAQARFYFPHFHKSDPVLTSQFSTILTANSTNETNSTSEYGPGRMTFQNDSFISDYIKIADHGEEESSLYFLLAESRDSPETDPLVIWLQGGPGCSSMLGLYTENGPYNYRYNASSISERAKFEYNEHSWNNHANVLYLDQPIGTGFSFAETFGQVRSNELDVAFDFFVFLSNFYATYPEYRERALFLTGESFAGHYIPAMANFLHTKTHVKISGLMIGNGWVDPFYQYPSYPNFAADNDIITAGHAKVLNIFYMVCRVALILETPILSTFICQMSGLTIATPVYPEFNMYDIREPCTVPGLCYPDNHLWEVLNSEQYRVQFGIKDPYAWEMCAPMAHLKLMLDLDKMYGYYLAPLLDDGVAVLIYNGDKDYICNWMGGLAWTDALKWAGQTGYQNAEMQPWTTSSGREAGMTKRNGNLSFLRVYDAGHMVPMDQPESAEDMLLEFL